MSEHGHDRGNMFPHDGEHGRSCTGYGCDCDEQNYGSRGGRRNNPDPESAGKFWVFYIIAILVGTIVNELLGAIMIGGLIFWLWAKDA